ncbi:MAG: hypothetical protein JWR24_736 [Actinoallomurus sp.]|jgi:WXG100 family type VII secretion target|nr:hypothetical protein [Actinoallomurus sp.]
MPANDGSPSTTVGGVTYRVTPEYLAQAATNTDQTAAEIDAVLAQIKSYVVNLESSWQGIAQQQFQVLMQEYDIYAKMLHDALTGISSGLRGNYVNYRDSEQTNINNLNALGAEIPAANFS